MTDLSTIAAVISAAGGSVACFAAFKSAKHAKDTFDAAQLSEKRQSLRQLSITAHEVIIQIDRINLSAQSLKSAYSELARHSGQLCGSTEKKHITKIENEIEKAKSLTEKAKPFIEFQTHLLNGPIGEISSREVDMTQCLNQAKAILNELNIEFLNISTQNQTYRTSIINNLTTNNIAP
jgi:hypothetical protein